MPRCLCPLLSCTFERFLNFFLFRFGQLISVILQGFLYGITSSIGLVLASASCFFFLSSSECESASRIIFFISSSASRLKRLFLLTALSLCRGLWRETCSIPFAINIKCYFELWNTSWCRGDTDKIEISQVSMISQPFPFHPGKS